MSRPRPPKTRRGSSSGYVGVYRRGNRWEACYKGQYIGLFRLMGEACEAVAALIPKKKVGRKPVPAADHHWYTLDEIMRRCGAESIDECWDHYVGMYGQEPTSEHARRYPSIVHGGVIKALVRRLAWFLAFGEDPPEGMLLVMTKCDNPRCQNPYHAKPMWEEQKCKIAAKKGNFSSLARRAKIAAGKQAIGKLDWDKVDKIRADQTPYKDEPWKAFGISSTMWKRIRAHKSWVRFDNPMARMAA